jgi:hypothetical protein
MTFTWADKTDAQLLDAFSEIEDYTPEGQDAIRSELNRRGLQPERRTATFDEAVRVAKLYRRFVVSVAMQWVPLLVITMGPGLVVLPVSELLLVGIFIVGVVMTPVTGYRLLKHLEVEAPAGLAAFMYWPLFNLLSLFAISGYAQQWGRRRGVAMGAVGPTSEALEELRRSEASRACDYFIGE